MLAIPKVWPVALSLLAGPSLSESSCPAKISAKLCPLFEASPDSAYLQVRIVLDLKVESSYVWDKSLPPTPRPLLTDSKGLIAKYDLRQLAHPESAYVPLWPSQDLSPANEEVQFHNASVTKENVGKLVSETYVAAVEQGCSRMMTALCTEINTKPDSANIFFSLGLTDTLERDAAARKTYLSKYAVRDTAWTTSRCMAVGYMGTPIAIRALGMDAAVRYLEPGGETCILHLNSASGPALRGSPAFRNGIFRSHRLDGRTIPDPRPNHP